MGGGGIVEQWWRRPASYDWFGEYLQRQRMLGLTRTFVALGSLSLGLVALSMYASRFPPRGQLGTALALASGVCGIGCALIFIRRWPTKGQSQGFAVIASIGIAFAALSQSNPDAAIHACTGFAVLAGYIAIFHTAPLMAYNFWMAVAVASYAMVRLSHTVGLVAAAAAFAVVVIANLTAPLGIQIVVSILGGDVAQGDYDALTGLLNRAALYRRARAIAEKRDTEVGYLCAAVIDLDRFKQLNDQHGHREGDRALTAVGQALRACASPTATIGRVGGEEFVYVDVVHTSNSSALGERLRRAVADVPYPVTASVGTATAPHTRHHQHDTNKVIDDLIAAADVAMYEAKNNGGDQSLCALQPSPTTFD